MNDRPRFPHLVLIVTALFALDHHVACAEDAAIASADSAIIASFLAAPADSVKTRTETARKAYDQARNSSDGSVRRRLLASTAKLDPAHIDYWLELAEVAMETGYPDEAEAALVAARAVIEFADRDRRRDAIRDYSLMKSWWHFENGQWDDGLRWAERAKKYKAGIEGYLLAGLNTAPSALTPEEVTTAVKGLYPLNQGGNRRQNFSWCFVLHYHFHNIPFDARDMAEWLYKTTHFYQWDVFRWRAYGLYCESNGAYDLAGEYYRKSFRAHRFAEGNWVTGHEGAIPTADGSGATLPFWVNDDQGFVTGSQMAYAAYLHRRMTDAASRSDKLVWAERLQKWGARIELRHPRHPWVSLWLADALLLEGDNAEAESVAEFAAAKFEALDIEDPHLDRVLGHILLLRNHRARAEPMIRRSATRFPENGTCWMDLGLIEVFRGNNAAAIEAFETAVALDPSLAQAWYNRGLLKVHAGRFEEAAADLEKAAALRPDSAEITGLLAQVLTKLQSR